MYDKIHYDNNNNKKRMKSWHLLQHAGTSKRWFSVKGARCKKSRCSWLHLCEPSRADQSKGRKQMSGCQGLGWGGESMRSGCQSVWGYFHGGGCWKCSKINCDDGYTTLLKKTYNWKACELYLNKSFLLKKKKRRNQLCRFVLSIGYSLFEVIAPVTITEPGTY